MRTTVEIRLLQLSFLLFFLCLSVASESGHAQTAPRTRTGTPRSASIDEAIKASFGSVVQPATTFRPYYVSGDFNGDGVQDLAVVVLIKEKRSALPKDVRVINPFDGPKINFPQNSATEHKLALAIIHGWKTSQAAKFLLVGESPILVLEYGRATSSNPEDAKNLIEVMAKGGKRRRGQRFPRTARGDVILLGTEVGGDSTLYWNGRTYVWEDVQDD
jgi:hypothetical protein